MITRETVKSVSVFVTTVGTGIIVKSIIKNNVAPANVPTKVAVYAAAFVIASMAKDAVADETCDKIDAVANWLEANVTEQTNS